jgi:hypothetical protein
MRSREPAGERAVRTLGQDQHQHGCNQGGGPDQGDDEKERVAAHGAGFAKSRTAISVSRGQRFQ